ncbi:MAG: 16S rRNA (uracil(1498)-N(3))-methyltransferase [Acidobacteriia bacterium]|nr:16S rRNA (uracil(1498)-N(3))-methyltransferase [Terriglobia bacterium]
MLEGETAHHLGRVLRAQPGQLYELSDGERVWLGRIESAGKERIEFALVEELPAVAPEVRLTLLLAVVKFDALEWALEKATELGVGTIVPLAAARSEKALLAAAPKRAERWQRILVEAAQQSRRLRPPVLKELTRVESAFAACGEGAGVRVLLSERPEAPPLRRVLEAAASKEATFAVGPEGGWTEEEFAAGEKRGFAQVSLGRQILRTETAVVAGLAALNYALGER